MSKIVVIQQVADPESFRTGAILDAEPGLWGGRDVWFSPTRAEHSKIFFLDEVVEVGK